MNSREAQIECLNALKEIDSILTNNNIWYSLSYGSALGAYREHGIIKWDRDIDIMISRADQVIVTKLIKEKLSEKYILISHIDDSVGGYDEIHLRNVDSSIMHIDIYPVIAGPNDYDEAYLYLNYCRIIHKLASCKTLDYNRLICRWKMPFVILIRIIESIIPNKLIRRYINHLMDKYSFEKAIYFFPFANDGKRGEIMTKELLFNVKRIKFEDALLPAPSNIEDYLRSLYGNDFMNPIQY